MYLSFLGISCIKTAIRINLTSLETMYYPNNLARYLNRRCQQRLKISFLFIYFFIKLRNYYSSIPGKVGAVSLEVVISSVMYCTSGTIQLRLLTGDQRHLQCLGRGIQICYFQVYMAYNSFIHRRYINKHAIVEQVDRYIFIATMFTLLYM